MKRKRICCYILAVIMLLTTISIDRIFVVRAYNETVIKVNGMKILSNTPLTKIQKKFGKPKIVTESMYGGQAYSFYKGDYKNYLYLESDVAGKWIGAGSVGTKFSTASYKSGKKADNYIHDGTCIYDDEEETSGSTKKFRIYGAVEYVSSVNYTKAQKAYCKSVACRAGMAQHVTAIRNAVWKYKNKKERGQYDQDSFLLIDSIAQAGKDVGDYAASAGCAGAVSLHGYGKLMYNHMDPFMLAEHGKEYDDKGRFPYVQASFHKRKGSYWYYEGCYNLGIYDAETAIRKKFKVPDYAEQPAVPYLVKKKNTSLTMQMGDSKLLSVKGQKKTVTWKSKNTKIVRVSHKNKITALKKGSTQITTTYAGKKYTCHIKVKKKVIKTSTAGVSVKTGDSLTLKLSKKQKGSGWYLEDNHIAQITKQTQSQVTIKGITSGTTTLRVKAGTEQKRWTIVVSEKYRYSLTPLLAPFNNYFYLKTDDPDPYDLVFIDRDSVYLTEAVTEEKIQPVTKAFFDVAYENETMFRVKGGYICYSSGFSDGGELKMMRNLKKEGNNYSPISLAETDGSVRYMERMDTGVTISCSKVKSSYQYLIDTYTRADQNLFDNLASVQKGLEEISIYPLWVVDETKPNQKTPFPYFAASPYPELTPNSWVEVYERTPQSSHDSLAMCVYPYVLNSASFPGTLRILAKWLDPTCTVERGDMHWEIIVSKGGVSRYFGGSGNGSPATMMKKRFIKSFRFDGTSDDQGTHATLTNLQQQLSTYYRIAIQDEKIYTDMLYGDTFNQAIGSGNWCRIALEGTEGVGYAYYYRKVGTNQTEACADTWVDGRYIGKYHVWEAGTNYEQHPKASIILRNQSYVTKNGEPQVRDIKYDYDPSSGTWKAYYNYVDKGSYTVGEELPERFILTEDQVKALIVDANTDLAPQHGVICDGTQMPGTLY